MSESKRPNHIWILFVLVSFLAGNQALGQAGDGKPVSANPFVKVSIDEKSGCVILDAETGKETKRPEPALFCADFNVAKTFHGDPVVQAAKRECVKFYELALRVQNLFCSYSTDAALFAEKSAVEAAGPEVGKQSVSVHAVAADNRTLAGINKKYLERLAVVGQSFHDQFPRYVTALGKLSSAAGSDYGKEATCRGLPAPTNLGLSSQSPGFLRQLLEAASGKNANITYETIWGSIRTNFKHLKESKEKAEANDSFNQPVQLEVPVNFDQAMKKNVTTDSRKPLTPGEGAIYSVVQYAATESAKKFAATATGKMLKIPEKLAPVIGGTATMVWQIHTNKQVMYLETGAAFLGVFNIYAGLTANVLIGFYRNTQNYHTEYMAFSHEQLKKNVDLTAPQLVVAWGERPEKSESCIGAGKMEAQCAQVRAQGGEAYARSNCAQRGIESPNAIIHRGN